MATSYLLTKSQLLLANARLVPLLVFLLLGLIYPSLLLASDKISVVAVVNGQPITTLDLENRMVFLRAVTDLNISDEILTRDTLQALVEEKLKIQTANEILPNLLERARAPARNLVNQTFARDDKTGSQILKEMGVELSTVLEKYTADILWGNTLQTKFRRQFENLNNLAEQELNRIRESKSEPQIKLSEILLVPNPQRNLENTLKFADEIYAALEKGANFAGIAQQYSDAASAQRGGRIDWVFSSRLPADIRTALETITSGNLIGPIKSNGQVFILRKEAIRKQGLLDPKAALLTLARAISPVPKDASEGERLEAAGKLQKQVEILSSCKQIETLNTTLGSGANSLLADLTIGALSSQLQDVISPLQVGEKSRPLSFDEGMVVFMVCERKLPEISLPDIETIMRAEFNKLYASISGRYLLRLQRTAIIDYRN